jgi:TRAP-type C4-dicarboxylate transport system substrate-binding protein
MNACPASTTRGFDRSRTSRPLYAILAAALFGLANVSAAQDKPVNLRLSTWVPAQHPLNPALTAWAEDIKKASGGTITATLYPSEQLGKAFDAYDIAKDGIADFSWVNPGFQPGRFPIAAGAALPFIFSNAKGGSAAMDAWYRQYAGKEMKDVKFCLAFIQDPGTFHSKKKITSPGDVKGLKVRPASSTVAQMVTLLGGANVQASTPEARDVLERGVADAITFPWGSILLFGIDKVTNYHLDLALYTTPFVWVMNKDKYDALSASQKHVIDDHCTTEWAEKIASPWADFEMAGRVKLMGMSGHETTEPTPEQTEAWKKAVAPLEAQWGADIAKTGNDPKAIMNSLRENAAKYKSAF